MVVFLKRASLISLTKLPKDLPIPIDDGRSDHLWGMQWPSLKLMVTNQRWVSLAQIKHYAVVYAYSMTGWAEEPLPENWDDISGARGCTPQSCSFRDYYAALQQLNAQVFGLNLQGSAYQLEAQ